MFPSFMELAHLWTTISQPFPSNWSCPRFTEALWNVNPPETPTCAISFSVSPSVTTHHISLFYQWQLMESCLCVYPFLITGNHKLGDLKEIYPSIVLSPQVQNQHHWDEIHIAMILPEALRKYVPCLLHILVTVSISWPMSLSPQSLRPALSNLFWLHLHIPSLCACVEIFLSLPFRRIDDYI